MRSRSIPVAAFAVLAAVGCVPVNEPVGDVEKAEPDKELIGKWSATRSDGIAALFELKTLTVDAPEVAGNPKGLLRATTAENDPEGDIWFFTSAAGKHACASLLVGAGEGDKPPALHRAGAYAKWKKEAVKRYFVFRYARDGDRLTIDCGSYETFTELMSDAKIKGDGRKHIEFFATPAGWLDKYLAKTGPDKVFDGTNVLALAREKKK